MGETVKHASEGGGRIQERRINRKGRRQCPGKLPCYDANGDYVVFERRYYPDRRESHYDPNWFEDHL